MCVRNSLAINAVAEGGIIKRTEVHRRHAAC